ncbi:MAG: cell division regulator GpsB [Solibacillus sp.]
MTMDIKLTSDYILEKDFKKSMKGYNIDEVDQFLDMIREDYDTFAEKIAQLERENAQLKQELETSSRRTQTAAPQQANNTNFDILKRLSNLEKHVFGSKLYE